MKKITIRQQLFLLAIFIWSANLQFANAAKTGVTYKRNSSTSGIAAPAGLTASVNDSVTPRLHIAANPDTVICAGAKIVFTATPSDGGPNSTYQWMLNGTAVDTGATYTTTALADSDVVACLLTSDAAFTTTKIAHSNNLQISVLGLPLQPEAFASKTTFVYQGQTAVEYAVPNVSGVSYSWSFNGSGAAINGTGNIVSVDYGDAATSGTLSVKANNICGVSPARSLDIVLNKTVQIPTDNFDYSFVTVGCNRVDYLDTTLTTGHPDYSCGASTANVYQLKRLFTEVSHLNPLPKYLFMTGDIVMGYINDTTALARQLTAWRQIYENHPLSSTEIQLVVLPGNHETQDKAAGKKSFVAAERTFTRVMAPYILGSNGPGIGGVDSLKTDQSKLTYSFDNGSDHFIVIDTDPVGKDGITPYRWIASDVKAARANNARHIFAFGHKPAYSSPFAPQGGLDAPATISQRDSLWKYLEENNCEAMFAAHEHLWDSIRPHAGKTFQIISANGGSRVEAAWVGPEKHYYGYTLVNIYTDRTVNVMGLGRNTTMSPKVGTPYTINEDASPTTIRKNFNICLTTKSHTKVAACNSYTWNDSTYTTSGNYKFTTTNVTGCDSVATLQLVLHTMKDTTDFDHNHVITSAAGFTNQDRHVSDSSGGKTATTFDLSVYPNPLSSLGNVTYFIEKSAHVQLCLIDLQGRKIKTFINEIQKGLIKQSIDITDNDIPDGMYIISLGVDGKFINRPVVVRK